MYRFLNMVMLGLGAFALCAHYVREDSVRWGPMLIIVAAALAVGIWLVRQRKRLNRTMCLTAASVLLAGEVLLRILGPGSYGQNAYRFPRPYLTFAGRPDSVVDGVWQMQGRAGPVEPIHLNHLGFRGEEPALPKPDGELRIFMVGGSVVFNGTPLSCCIPALLQECFAKDAVTSVRVYNFGAVGFVSGQELSLVIHVLARYKPDIVLVYDGGNDVMSPFFYDPRPGYPYNYHVFERGFEILGGKRLTLVQQVSSALLKSQLAARFFGRDLQNLLLSTRALRQQAGYRTPDWEQQIADQYLSNVAAIAAAGRGFGYRTIAILQPLAQFKSPRTPAEDRVLGAAAFCQYAARQYDRIRAGYTRLQNELPAEAALFIDLSRVLEGYPQQTYWDFIHTDNQGNQYLAAQIYARIKDWCLKPPQ